MRIALALAVALAAVPAAQARELASPLPHEAFFGAVRVSAPPGATHAELYVGDRRVSRRAVEHGRAVFLVPRRPGRYDLRVRFERGSRLVRRDESRRVWLLPRTGMRTRREAAADAALARRFGELGRAFRGYAAFWAHDLVTGSTAGWNSDASFPAASMVKLGVLVAALDRFGPRPERSAAWSLIRDLAVWSSNDASNKLLLLLGGSEAGGSRVVNETLHRLGATSSHFTGNYRLGTGPAAPLADAPRPLPLLTYRRTTARDVGRMLLELHSTALGSRVAARRTRLSIHEARLALGLLLSSDPRGDNSGLFRHETAAPLAQKHGWTTKLRHSAAIEYAPQGPRIVVVLTFHPKRIDPDASRRLGGLALGSVRSAW